MVALLVSVGIPLAVLCVISLIGHFVEPLTFRNWCIKTGWEMCIMAMGVTGGAFANDAVIGRFGQQMAIVIALLTFIMGLGAAVIIAHLRRTGSRWASSISVFLGIIVISIPAYLMFTS